MSDPDAPTTVTTQTADRVRIVTIDRFEVRNAVDRSTAAQLEAAFADFDADDSVDVAVLTGAGGAFCAGADLGAISTGAGNVMSADLARPGPMGPTRMRLTKPVIAAIEGPAVAGGLELALWCDLRVAAQDATLGVYCRRFGVPLVDGGTVRLPRLIGQSRAIDLILTGRGIDGTEAERIGLVNRVVAPGHALDAAVELARSLSAFPQRCMRSDRASALAQWELPGDEAMQFEIDTGLGVIASGETVEGATRFAGGEGRSGTFPT